MTVSLGGTGPGVGVLHQKLLELGYGIGPDELKEARFGASTLAAVLEFQSVHVGRDGERLVADGVVGPRTNWAIENFQGPAHRFTAPGWRYDTTTMRPEARLACFAAICDLGKRELNGTNDGPEIAKFDPKGMPWCAQAVSTWLEATEGGSPLGERRRSVLKIVEWARGKAGRIVPASQAAAGDIWCVLRKDLHGHCELIVHAKEGGMLCCVGGNVGNAVRGTIRDAAQATIIVRAIPVNFAQ